MYLFSDWWRFNTCMYSVVIIDVLQYIFFWTVYKSLCQRNKVVTLFSKKVISHTNMLRATLYLSVYWLYKYILNEIRPFEILKFQRPCTDTTKYSFESAIFSTLSSKKSLSFPFMNWFLCKNCCSRWQAKQTVWNS